MNEHEAAFVCTFIAKRRRERFGTLLSNPKRRSEILDRLNHDAQRDFDPRFCRPIPSDEDVFTLLKEFGSPRQVYIFSSDPDLDAKVCPLKEAAQKVSEGPWGSVISCIPGKLAYFQGEAWRNTERILLLGPEHS